MKFCQLLLTTFMMASTLLMPPTHAQDDDQRVIPDLAEAVQISDPSDVDDPRLSDFLIPGQYIVHFNEQEHLTSQQIWEMVSLGFQVEPVFLYLYTHHFQGVALAGIVETDLQALHEHSMVKRVEQDTRLVLDQVHKQPDPPNWGLDRIDHDYFADGKDNTFNDQYRFAEDGHNVNIFLLDTGVHESHDDFDEEHDPEKRSHRVLCAFDAFGPDHLQYNKEQEFDAPTACQDAVGHGTFMAGIIGGTYMGVAKRSLITSVKIFDNAGNGSVASALAGLQFVQYIQDEAFELDIIQRTVVVNMSFGTPIPSYSMSLATQQLYDSNVFLVASAGNTGSYACNHYPAGYHHVFTVAASTHEDTLAPFSNHGRCVNLVAPGSRITSLWHRGDADLITLSGTSAAAAHVSGAAALVLAQIPEVKPHGLYNLLESMAIALESLDTKPETTTRLVNIAKLVRDAEA